MSLDRIVKLIVDDSGTISRHMRAIRLFELQVAIFNLNSFRKLVSTERDDRAPSKLLRTARIFAATKFLEDIEAELQKGDADKSVSIKQLVENLAYQAIFDEVIAPNGGWPQIRQSVSAKSFDNKIAAQCKQAETAAKIIDFSYRYDKNPIDTKYKGGITAACYVVRTANSYDSKMGETTCKNRWRTFDTTTAAFLYLLLIRKLPLMPPKVSSKTFSEKLLKQAGEIATLRGFFRAYQDVCEALKRQGYKLKTLDYKLNCDVPRFEVSAFPPDVVTAFEES